MDDMVIEVAGLIASVGAISKLIGGSLELVQSIRSRRFAKNDSAKKQLAKHLTDIKKNLKRVGKLAQMADEYMHVLENVLRLQLLVSQAKSFLDNNYDDCDSWSNDNYPGNWRVLQVMVQAIQDNMGALRKVEQGRAKWDDLTDKIQIGGYLKDCATHYRDAAKDARNRDARELAHDLRDMTNDLKEAETALRGTIYGDILKNLQGLGV